MLAEDCGNKRGCAGACESADGSQSSTYSCERATIFVAGVVGRAKQATNERSVANEMDGGVTSV